MYVIAHPILNFEWGTISYFGNFLETEKMSSKNIRKTEAQFAIFDFPTKWAQSLSFSWTALKNWHLLRTSHICWSDPWHHPTEDEGRGQLQQNHAPHSLAREKFRTEGVHAGLYAACARGTASSPSDAAVQPVLVGHGSAIISKESRRGRPRGSKETSA